MAGCCAFVWTVRAHKLLFTRVGEFVHGQIGLVSKFRVTLVTLVWLFACVRLLVAGEIASLCTRVRTLITLVWFFTCVRHLVAD